MNSHLIYLHHLDAACSHRKTSALTPWTDFISSCILNNCPEIKYDKLINTSPLDATLRMVGLTQLAARLKHSSTHVVGIGVRGSNPFDDKCWLYYPEDCCPFYRCTVFSNYAEQNCPAPGVKLPTLRLAKFLRDEQSLMNQSSQAEVEKRPGPYHSFMFEISESVEHKHVSMTTLVDDTIEGAIKCGLLKPPSEIVSIFHRRLEYGYPTPHIDRDNVLSEALLILKSHNVWNRGRFGCWKYEVRSATLYRFAFTSPRLFSYGSWPASNVSLAGFFQVSNQDHSLMLGVEAVDHILLGTLEVTLETPSLINARGQKQTDRVFSLKKTP